MLRRAAAAAALASHRSQPLISRVVHPLLARALSDKTKGGHSSRAFLKEELPAIVDLFSDHAERDANGALRVHTIPLPVRKARMLINRARRPAGARASGPGGVAGIARREARRR
eukprot:3378590-Prymnesium_polylepis.1